jgi:hypothetical protein
MPKQKSDSSIYRPDLGQAVLEFYEEPLQGYIGLSLMPVFRTSKQSSSYPVIPKEALLDAPDVDRAPRAAYQRGSYETERGYFATSERGYEEPLDDTERELLDLEAPGAAEMVATKRAFGMIMRAQEKRIASVLFNTTNFTVHNVSTEWSKPATADPVADVNDGVLAFRGQCGMLPDTLAFSYKVFMNLKKVTKIRDQLKYTFPGLDLNALTAAQMAQLFNVPRVLIGGAVYNSADKDLDASISDIWDDEYALLAKVGGGQDIVQPCVGRTFLWTEDSAENPIVEEYREESKRSDIYRVRHHVSEELIRSIDNSGSTKSNVSAACAYLFGNITA